MFRFDKLVIYCVYFDCLTFYIVLSFVNGSRISFEHFQIECKCEKHGLFLPYSSTSLLLTGLLLNIETWKNL